MSNLKNSKSKRRVPPYLPPQLIPPPPPTAPPPNLMQSYPGLMGGAQPAPYVPPEIMSGIGGLGPILDIPSFSGSQIGASNDPIAAPGMSRPHPLNSFLANPQSPNIAGNIMPAQTFPNQGARAASTAMNPIPPLPTRKLGGKGWVPEAALLDGAMNIDPGIMDYTDPGNIDPKIVDNMNPGNIDPGIFGRKPGALPTPGGLSGSDMQAILRQGLLDDLGRYRTQTEDLERYINREKTAGAIRQFLGDVAAPLAAGFIGPGSFETLGAFRRSVLQEKDQARQAQADLAKNAMDHAKTLVGIMRDTDPETIKAQIAWMKAQADTARAQSYGKSVEYQHTDAQARIQQGQERLNAEKPLIASRIKDLESQMQSRVQNGEISQGRLQVSQGMLDVLRERAAQAKTKDEWDAYQKYSEMTLKHLEWEISQSDKEITTATGTNAKGQPKNPGARQMMGVTPPAAGTAAPPVVASGAPAPAAPFTQDQIMAELKRRGLLK